jgi:hypothetical protein
MAAPLAALVFAGPLSLPTPPHARAAPFIALVVAGFALAVIGHIVRSRTAVVAGILMLVAATVVLPFVLYLRQH